MSTVIFLDLCFSFILVCLIFLACYICFYLLCIFSCFKRSIIVELLDEGADFLMRLQ